jgi:hypothetical protein
MRRPEESDRRRLARARWGARLTTVPMVLLVCAWLGVMFADGAGLARPRAALIAGALLLAVTITRLILIRPFAHVSRPGLIQGKPVYGWFMGGLMVFFLAIASVVAVKTGDCLGGYLGHTVSVPAAASSCSTVGRGQTCQGRWTYAGRTYSGDVPGELSAGGTEIIKIRSSDPGEALSSGAADGVLLAVLTLVLLLGFAGFVGVRTVALHRQFASAEATRA